MSIALAVHLFVVFYEEPTLARNSGQNTKNTATASAAGSVGRARLVEIDAPHPPQVIGHARDGGDGLVIEIDHGTKIGVDGLRLRFEDDGRSESAARRARWSTAMRCAGSGQSY